jgi:O-antigen/teichoic acid export membrane protein
MISFFEKALSRLRALLREHHTIRSHFWQTCANYTQQIGGLALGIMLARIMLPEDFGLFAYASALALICLLPFHWSLSASLLATKCENYKLVRHAWNLAGWICAVKILVVLFLVAWFAWNRDFLMAWLILLNGLPHCFFEFINLLRAEVESVGNFKPHLLSAVATLIVVLIFNIPLAFFGLGAIALSAGGIPLVAIQWILYRRATTLKLNRKITFQKIQQEYFHEGLWQWMTSMTDQAITRIDKVFLGQLSGQTELGNYNRAYGYAPISHLALSSLYTNATVAALGGKSSRRGKLDLLRKSGGIVIIVGILNAIFWLIFSDWIVPWVFGSQWYGSISVFKAMAGFSLCLAIFYLPTTVLFHQRKFKVIGLTRLMGTLLFLLCVFALNHRMTAVTMALLLQAILLIIGLILSFYAWKGLDNEVEP